VHGAATLASTLSVTGTAHFKGATSTESALSVGAQTTLSSSLSVHGAAILSGGLVCTNMADFSNGTVLIASPTDNNNPATKEYVDTLAAGLTPKDAVNAATHGGWINDFDAWACHVIDADDIEIFVAGPPGRDVDLMIDGMEAIFRAVKYPPGGALIDESHDLAYRLLLKDMPMPDARVNGVYFIRGVETGSLQHGGQTYKAKWSLRRTSDFNEPASQGDHSDVTHGAYVFVETGFRNNHMGFMMSNERPVINALDGDGIHWTPISGAQSLTFDFPLKANGNLVSFGYDVGQFELESGDISLKDGGVANAKLAHSDIVFFFENGLAGPAGLELGAEGTFKIAEDQAITMQNITLTSNGAIGNPLVSLNAVNGEFSGELVCAGNLQCANLTQTSDQRVKDWEAMEAADCLSGIMALEPLVYSLKKSFVDVRGGSTDKHMGLLAQPLEKVFPHAVKTSSEPVKISEDETVADFKSVDYASLVAPLIGAVKALSAKVESLEAKIA
jgi:hypothetical protein